MYNGGIIDGLVARDTETNLHTVLAVKCWHMNRVVFSCRDSSH